MNCFRLKNIEASTNLSFSGVSNGNEANLSEIESDNGNEVKIMSCLS